MSTSAGCASHESGRGHGGAVSAASRRRFVFMYPYEPGAYERRSRGIEQVRSLGFEVEILVVPVLPGSPRLAAAVSHQDGIRVTVTPDEASLMSYLAEKAATSVFIDVLFGFSEPTLRGRFVLPSLARCAAVYCVVAGGALPPVAPMDGQSRLKRQLRLATSPARLADFLWRKVGGRLGLVPAVPRPVAVFASRSEPLESYLLRMGLDHSAVTRVNSFDYDVALDYLASHGGRFPESEPFAVFLDEDASGHVDFGLLAESSIRIDPAEYSASLRRLFDAVESNTGLRVVVAAHPRADYSAQPGFFGERDLVVGSTVDLVARSSMVIAHASTAVSFAAIADKPLMIVKTASMVASSYGSTVDRIARGLALEPVLSDEPGVLDNLNWDYVDWSRAGYPAYLERYVHSQDAPSNTSTWEIVAETLGATGVLDTPETCD